MNIENKILDISHKHYKYLMTIENVKGIALGFKWINNINTFEPCIHVLVNNKISDKYVSLKNRIPKVYMGIKTDVIDLEVLKQNNIISNSLKEKVRPLKGGYGISAYDDKYIFGFGTITCIVTRKKLLSTDYFILSNYHVMIRNDKKNANIMQPSVPDGGTTNDKVGVVTDFVPIKASNSYLSPTNYVDCAIAKISKVLASNLIGIVGKIKGVGEASLGLKVKKIGKNTGVTEGIITSVGATIKAKVKDKGNVMFKDQIIASTNSAPGDSGSPLLNENNEIIGLLIGENAQGKSSFNDIKNVLKLLKVNIYV